jgi:hypothetical protein
MNAVRTNEESKTWFRSERVFLSNGHWYFHTREGVDVGPYDTQFEAEIEAGMLKELLRERLGASGPVSGDHAMDVIREFVLDSYVMGRPLSPTFGEVEAR